MPVIGERSALIVHLQIEATVAVITNVNDNGVVLVITITVASICKWTGRMVVSTMGGDRAKLIPQHNSAAGAEFRTVPNLLLTRKVLVLESSHFTLQAIFSCQRSDETCECIVYDTTSRR